MLYGGTYYYLKQEGSVRGTAPGSGDAWQPCSNFDAIFAKIGIIANGLIGSAVFNGDWMFSQQGFYNSDPSTAVSYSAATAAGKLNTSYFYSESSSYASYWSPCFAVNLNTGDMYGARGSLVAKYGSLKVTGEVNADSGNIGGVAIGDNSSQTCISDAGFNIYNTGGTYGISTKRNAFTENSSVGRGHLYGIISTAQSKYPVFTAETGIVTNYGFVTKGRIVGSALRHYISTAVQAPWVIAYGTINADGTIATSGGTLSSVSVSGSTYTVYFKSYLSKYTTFCTIQLSFYGNPGAWYMTKLSSGFKLVLEGQAKFDFVALGMQEAIGTSQA